LLKGDDMKKQPSRDKPLSPKELDKRLAEFEKQQQEQALKEDAQQLEKELSELFNG
jgi:hypothetical protein